MRKEQGEISQTSYKKCTIYGKRLMFDSIKIKNFSSGNTALYKRPLPTKKFINVIFAALKKKKKRPRE